MVLPNSGPLSLLDINSEYVPNTSISGAQTSSTTTITVVNTSTFPSSGNIIVRSSGEFISYTSKTATTFTGCTRGALGSSAQALTDKDVVSVYRTSVSLLDFYATGTYVNQGLQNGVQVSIPSSGELSLTGFYGGVAALALFKGGSVSGTNVADIAILALSSLGNSNSFGTLSAAKNQAGAGSSSVRSLYAGGFATTSVIEYVTYLAGTVSAFGSLTVARYLLTGCGSTTRAMFAGGNDVTIHRTDIDYVTMATAGNASFFGNLLFARSNLTSCGSTTRAIFATGFNSSFSYATIEYVTIATTGNTTSFGSVPSSKSSAAGASSSTRGVFMGGSFLSATTSPIDYITIATTGNSTTFGTLHTGVRYSHAATSSSIRAVCGGGNKNGVTYTSDIDYITIVTTGNGSTFGSLTVGNMYLNATSNNHGGLYS